MTTRLELAIRGTGVGIPSRRMTNADFERILDTTDEWIVTRTGIRERRLCDRQRGESTLSLARDASRQALRNAGISPADLDLILCATVTPEYPLPATACLLQGELEAGNAGAMDLSAACAGFIYALVLAGQAIQTRTHRCVLVVAADMMSAIMDYEDRSACILFGDAAAAAVVTPPERDGQGLVYHTLGADGKGARMIWIPAGGVAEPASIRTVNERLHYVKMEGRKVYRFAVEKMQETIRQSLDEAGVSVDDIKMIIPHQSNLRIIESAAAKLGLPPEKVYVNIDRYGNTSAASVAVALHELRTAGRVGPGDLVLLVAFGAGLTWASAVLRL